MHLKEFANFPASIIGENYYISHFLESERFYIFYLEFFHPNGIRNLEGKDPKFLFLNKETLDIEIKTKIKCFYQMEEEERFERRSFQLPRLQRKLFEPEYLPPRMEKRKSVYTDGDGFIANIDKDIRIRVYPLPTREVAPITSEKFEKWDRYEIRENFLFIIRTHTVVEEDERKIETQFFLLYDLESGEEIFISEFLMNVSKTYTAFGNSDCGSSSNKPKIIPDKKLILWFDFIIDYHDKTSLSFPKFHYIQENFFVRNEGERVIVYKIISSFEEELLQKE